MGREPGRSGGRRVKREFQLVMGDGDRWPDESKQMTNDPKLLVPDDAHQSWAWAIGHIDKHRGTWLKVPLVYDHGTAKGWSERNSVRSTLWSTSRRIGIQLESSEWMSALWFRVR